MTVTCLICNATPPDCAICNDGGPIRWLFDVHWPAAHPLRPRTALE